MMKSDEQKESKMKMKMKMKMKKMMMMMMMMKMMIMIMTAQNSEVVDEVQANDERIPRRTKSTMK